MALIRLLLMIAFTTVASMSTVMDVGHSTVATHHHAEVVDISDDRQVCCEDDSRGGQDCHAVQAVLAIMGTYPAPASAPDDPFAIALVLPVGTKLPGSLDPPRLS
ncbi:hypothetical protein [Roseobacter sp. HKCCA0434]|uniref:hypothetical protein n=1 Tax=Roseobacter sp. HKCCA0434 TaxID=3079297 RepID=UPI002905817F|nr:hypothetical protein [Roseobacter sp. HKCCA0434]